MNKTIWSLLNNGLEFLLGFGIIAIVTRFFPQEEAGKWFIFMSIFSIAGGMRDAFVQTALVKGSVGMEASKENENLKANLITTLTLELILSTIILTLGLLKISSIYTWLLLYPLYAIPNSIFRWVTFYLRSKLLISAIFTINILNIGILSIFIIGLLSGGFPITYLIAAWGLANTIALVLSVKYVPFKRIFATKWQPDSLKLIGRYGLYATLRELTATLSTRIGIFLSGSLLGLHSTALLGTGQRYTQIVFIPNNSLQALLFPDLVKHVNTGKMEEAKQTLQLGLARILGLVFIVGAIIICLSYPLVMILHGEKYLMAVPILIFYVFIGSFFTPFGTAFGSYITAIGKPQISSKIVFINSMINILLTWVLLSSIGLYGAPLSLLITEIFGFIMIGRILKKEAGIRFSTILIMIPGQIKEGFLTLNKLFLKHKPAIT